MIVGAQEQATAGRERIRLADVLQGAGRVGGEDGGVVAGRVEPLEHGAARAFDELSRPRRGRTRRMRIAERLRVQQLRVPTHLRRGVQTGAGVIQIDLRVLVQPPVLGRAQRVEMERGSVFRIAREKLGVRVGLVWSRSSVSLLPATSYRLPATPTLT